MLVEAAALGTALLKPGADAEQAKNRTHSPHLCR